MSKPTISSDAYDFRSKWLQVLDDISGWGFYVSLIVSVLTLVYLLYEIVGTSTNNVVYTHNDMLRLLGNTQLVGEVFIGSLIVMILSLAWMFYEKEILGYGFLAVGAAVAWGVPALVRLVISDGRSEQAAHLRSAAIDQIKLSFWVFLLPAAIFICLDLALRLSRRIRYGAKKDTLQYGKDIIEEKDVRKRFMGKCWQLPFCRAFVRKKCPIYHAKRTCWKERVGCMCEESVIQNAMSGLQTFSKDKLVNAKYIPYNNTLPMWVKKERCRNCVIYNEHQRHKYRLFSPMLIIAILGGAYTAHDALAFMLSQGFTTLDKWMTHLSLAPSGTAKHGESIAQALASSGYAAEMVLICGIVIFLAYALKVLEYFIFSLKI